MQDEKKRSVGRPTKLTDDVLKFAKDYIDNYQEYEDINGKLVPNNIPSQCDLAFKLNVHRETIANWGKNNCQFFDILERINQKQELMLQKFGLNRGYDATITKLYTVNLTKYKDRVDHQVDQKTIQINVDSDDSKL